MLSDHAWSLLRDTVTLLILGLTVWAIIYGPIRAVVVQRESEEKREAKRRQYGILHSLMKTRSWNLHQDHVMSLNLIQLEFYKHEAIQTAYRSYREHLAFPAPTDPSQNRTFDDERQDRFYTLVKEIADVLDFTFDKADLRRLSYTPQGWHDDLSKQNYLRALFIEALEGRRPIPVSQFHMNVVNNKFPEPPAGVVKANDL